MSDLLEYLKSRGLGKSFLKKKDGEKETLDEEGQKKEDDKRWIANKKKEEKQRFLKKRQNTGEQKRKGRK